MAELTFQKLDTPPVTAGAPLGDSPPITFTPITPGTSPEAQQAGGIPGLDYMWKLLTTTGSNIKKTVTSPTFMPGVEYGAVKPFYGAGQLASHAGMRTPVGGMPEYGMVGGPETPLVPPSEVDKPVQARAQAFKKETAKDPASALWGEILGGTIATAPLGVGGAGAAGRGVGRLALGTTGAGAVAGAAEPVTKGNYWTEKPKQIASTAAISGLVGTGAGAVGSVMAPRLAPDAQALASQGVRLTPGRVMPGPAQIGRRAEDRFEGYPIFGDFIRSGKLRSIDDFNRATINQAIAPIGAELPKGTKVGREAINTAHTAVSKAYDTVLNKIPSVAVDQDFGKAINDLIPLARKDPNVWRIFKGYLNQDVLEQFKAGPITGRELNRIRSDLGKKAERYARSADTTYQETAPFIRELRDILDENVARQYPDLAPELTKAREAYAMMERVGDASARRLRSDGKFTPTDLEATVRQQAGGPRSHIYQKGDALFQKWAETAQRLLPSEIPDSGTAGRWAWEHPFQAIPLGVAHTAASIPAVIASRTLQRQRFLAPDPVRNVFEDIAAGLSPGIGTAAGRR